MRRRRRRLTVEQICQVLELALGADKILRSAGQVELWHRGKGPGSVE